MIQLARRRKMVIITGHSLGGALSVLLSAALSRERSGGQHLACYTFGAPRCGSAGFAANWQGRFEHFRYVHSADPIPMVPPFILLEKTEWRPSITTVLPPLPAVILLSMVAERVLETAHGGRLEEVGIGSDGDEVTSLYAEARNAQLRAGRRFLVLWESNGFTRRHGPNHAEEMARICDADAEYQRLLSEANALNERLAKLGRLYGFGHLMDAYLDALRERLRGRSKYAQGKPTLYPSSEVGCG
jgi:hypothetical protein